MRAIGASEEVINIAEEQINIDTMNPNHKKFYDEDYIPTSRYFDFDVELLDDLVESYIGQRDYNLNLSFNKKKDISFVYQRIEGLDEEIAISLDFPDSEDFVNSIHVLLEHIKEYTFSI